MIDPTELSNKLYYYKAKLIRVVDGDTVKLEVDMGFRTHYICNVRFVDINAPEITSTDPLVLERALKAKDRVNELFLEAGNECVIYSKTLDKYGRPLVEIFLLQGTTYTNLNHQLLFEGLVDYILK